VRSVCVCVCVCVCACAYGFVAHGAERLQVVQRALSSSAVHRPDVVHLPEVAFHRSADHLVELWEESREPREGWFF